MTRTRSLPLTIATLAGAVVLSLLLAVAAFAQEPGVGLIVRDGDVVQYATPPEGCPSTGRINTAYDPWEAAGWNPYLGSPPPLVEPKKAARWQHANACRYGGYPGGLGCPPWPDGEWEAWYRALPPGCITGGAVSWSQHGSNAERWLRAWGAKFGRGDVQPTSLEKRDYDVSRTVLCRVHHMLGTDVCSPRPVDPVEPGACCSPEGAWQCDEIPAAIYSQCQAGQRCTVWQTARRAGVCEDACWIKSGGGLLSTTYQVVDTPRCRPGGGAEGPGDEEDDPPPDDEEDDEEEPPRGDDCACDLAWTNEQIVLQGERLLAAADAHDALERAHDQRLDELERTAAELRQAWEELRRDSNPPPEDDPPPPPECQTPAEREAALRSWALRNRNPGMVAAGWSGERTLQVIRAQPPGNWHRALLAAFEATLSPVCEADQGSEEEADDQGEDVAEIAWPELDNHHAETVERYRLHAWAIHGVLPPHVAMSSKRAANTPNQRFLRATDLYLTTGEASDLLAELATRHTAIMAAEQSDYRLYHPEAALVAALAAQARGGDEVEAEAKAWLASYCAYADLMSVGGVSRIPGPRIGAAYGRDAWRDETCRILSGAAPPRVGDWSILDSDAARHLAGRLRGQVTWSRADLPGVLSPLTVKVHQRGVVAEAYELVKAAGGPVWAVGADTAGNEVMVSWRDAGATAWKCNRNSPPGCVPANRWGGRTKKAPRELDTSGLDLGPLVEEWVLSTDGAERVR